MIVVSGVSRCSNWHIVYGRSIWPNIWVLLSACLALSGGEIYVFAWGLECFYLYVLWRNTSSNNFAMSFYLRAIFFIVQCDGVLQFPPSYKVSTLNERHLWKCYALFLLVIWLYVCSSYGGVVTIYTRSYMHCQVKDSLNTKLTTSKRRTW